MSIVWVGPEYYELGSVWGMIDVHLSFFICETDLSIAHKM